ncbi:MAG: nucleotide exchange factor GrpE [Candidatus Paceibacterota bacterium]
MNEDTQQDDVTIEPENNEESGGKDPREVVRKLKEKISLLEEQNKEYLSGWQRDKADFINARKRDEEEKKEIRKYATERLIDGLIPVLESFDMAMGNKEAWEKVDKNWRIGVEYIYNHFRQTLEQDGLNEINPLGKKFDSTRDEAIEYVPTADKNLEDTVIEVVQKGYSLNGKEIKAPKVKVGEYKGE